MTEPLAPVLGRLAAPPSASPWDPIRLAMVDVLVGAHAAGRLDGSAWLEAWTAAATAVRDGVIDEGQRRLQAAAAHSRFPAARLRRVIPDAAAEERLLQRLLAEGMALEALEQGSTSASMDRRRGAALEVAWDGAVRVAATEAARLRSDAERVRGWRRPWRPLVLVGTAATLVVLAVAAMIAGVIPAPAWFEPVIDWFWRWPWP